VEHPFLSLIIPAYNEEHRLPETLDRVVEFLDTRPYTWEILVVNNNSTDNTSQVISEYAERFPALLGLDEKRRGKGSAVQTGMLEARGEYRFMCDADLSMPIRELTRFLPPLLTDFEIAIASREAPGAVRYGEPHYRHLGGRLINYLIRLLVLPGLHDTQCGFKCFTREAARDLFSHQTLEGWSFDIEILTVARQRGYRVEEIPIPWYYNEDSKVNAVKDAALMIRDILKIRRNLRNGVYER
jgi:glycosyltransferase involved in cell wall biosynthesis